MLSKAIRPAWRSLSASVAGPSRCPAQDNVSSASLRRVSRNYATETSRARRPPRKERNAVHISNMSPSATENDVRTLVYRSLIRSGTNLVDESDNSTFDASSKQGSTDIGRQIVDIVFSRDKFLRRQDIVDIYMKQPEQAQRLADLLHGKTFGATTLAAKRGSEKYQPIDTKEHRILAWMNKASPGRVVIMRGLPSHLTQARMERVLRRHYDICDTVSKDSLRGIAVDEMDKGGNAYLHAVEEIAINPTSRTFLVRFQTVSDAMRCVRKWDGSVWRHTPNETWWPGKDEGEAADKGEDDEPIRTVSAASGEPETYRDPNVDPRLYEPGARLTPYAAARIRKDFTHVLNILDVSLCS